MELLRLRAPTASACADRNCSVHVPTRGSKTAARRARAKAISAALLAAIGVVRTSAWLMGRSRRRVPGGHTRCAQSTWAPLARSSLRGDRSNPQEIRAAAIRPRSEGCVLAIGRSIRSPHQPRRTRTAAKARAMLRLLNGLLCPQTRTLASRLNHEADTTGRDGGVPQGMASCKHVRLATIRAGTLLNYPRSACPILVSPALACLRVRLHTTPATLSVRTVPHTKWGHCQLQGGAEASCSTARRGRARATSPRRSRLRCALAPHLQGTGRQHEALRGLAHYEASRGVAQYKALRRTVQTVGLRWGGLRSPGGRIYH